VAQILLIGPPLHPRSFRSRSLVSQPTSTSSRPCRRILLLRSQFIERGAKLNVKVQVVDKASAVLGQANEIAVGVEGANHISMCKFSDPKSQKYLQVSRPIKKLVDSAVTSDPVPCTSTQTFFMIHDVTDNNLHDSRAQSKI